MAQAMAAALDVETALSELLEPGDPLPSPINNLYEHGLGMELGPKQ